MASDVAERGEAIAQLDSAEMLAVVVVRDGVLPAGADEACAEAGGRVLVAGTGVASVQVHGARHHFDLEVGEIEFGALALVLAAQPACATAAAIVLPASPDGRDLAPLLAHRLGRPLFAGAIRVTTEGVSAAHTGGRVAVTHAPGRPFVATLLPGVRGTETRIVGCVERTNRVATGPTPSQTASGGAPHAVRTIEVRPPDPSTMDLMEARRIVAGGQGLADAHHFALLADIGAALGASLGGTRVASDAGWIAFERQIGTTGVAVDPDLYLAFGISGATQHTAGLGHPEHIISVNTDPSCPMMAMADLAVVSDARAVIDALVKRLLP